MEKQNKKIDSHTVHVFDCLHKEDTISANFSKKKSDLPFLGPGRLLFYLLVETFCFQI